MVGSVSGVVSVVRQDIAGRPVYLEDGAGNFETRSYDKWGRLSLTVYGQGSTRRAARRYYNHLDRLTAEVETAGAGNDPPGSVLAAGQLDGVDGFSRAVFFGYDHAGRPKSREVYVGSPGAQATAVQDVTYAIDDVEQEMTVDEDTPSGTRRTIIQFDRLGRRYNRVPARGRPRCRSRRDPAARGPVELTATPARPRSRQDGARRVLTAQRQDGETLGGRWHPRSTT